MTDTTVTPAQAAKEAKADAQAEKARTKALRPWFKKKRFIFSIIIVVIILISAIAGGGAGDDSTTAGDVADTSAVDAAAAGDEAAVEEVIEEEENLPGIGEAAVDGKFTFTVSGVECGIPSVGDQYAGATAQGQFCQIALTVENTGNEPQTMWADAQKLFDAEGREFSADTTAMIYADMDSSTWLTEINPGNTLTGSLIFDVPADATLAQIELHDSLFSGGVEVALQ